MKTYYICRCVKKHFTLDNVKDSELHFLEGFDSNDYRAVWCGSIDEAMGFSSLRDSSNLLTYASDDFDLFDYFVDEREEV